MSYRELLYRHYQLAQKKKLNDSELNELNEIIKSMTDIEKSIGVNTKHSNKY